MNAVADSFKLGALLDYVFRRRDLAAVVQPGRNTEFAPLVIGIQREKLESWIVAGAGRPGQRLCDYRYTFAMASRVGRFLIDRRCNQFDDTVVKLLLLASVVAYRIGHGNQARGQRRHFANPAGYALHLTESAEPHFVTLLCQAPNWNGNHPDR